MDELDPRKVDRDVARAARAERAFRRALRADASAAAADAWYEPLRYLTTRTTFQEVSELPASDPRKEPLVRWVHRLALTRIAGRELVEAARHRQRASIELETPERGTFAARDLVLRALADREPARGRAWLDGIAAAAPSVLAAEKLARETEIEITSRLGVVDPASLAPFDPVALASEAKTLLAKTADLASSRFGSREHVAALVGDLVARDVPGVWPRAPDARWLFELFRGTPLLEGLALDLGTAPRSLGASSFARALARLGAAYARASVLAGGSFLAASDPSDAYPLRRGALFAGLLVDPLFLRKKLGLSREAAARTVRQVGASALAQARLDAMRTILDVALASPADIEEAASDAFRVHVPPALAGVLPRPDPRAAAKLAGALLAAQDRDALCDRFDEDWFENPHALEFLREVDAVPGAPRVPNEALAGSAERLARSLERMAG